YGINEVELHVELEKSALVILTDAYYPGWKAYLDADEKPVWRANSLFRAVETPPGDHRLVFKYQPGSVRLGIVVSLASFSFIILGLVWEFFFSRRLSES
ncbi:MAG: YfhO family protein, partial [Planctomycetota bacterium]